MQAHPEPSSLCVMCKSIVAYYPAVFPHHSLKDLETCQVKCLLCRLIYTELEREPRSDLNRVERSFSSTLSIGHVSNDYWWLWVGFRNERGSSHSERIELDVKSQIVSEMFVCVVLPPLMCRIRKDLTRRWIYPWEEHSQAEVYGSLGSAPGKPRTDVCLQNSSSSEAIKFISRWARHCWENHSECRGSRSMSNRSHDPGELPTRVLDIGHEHDEDSPVQLRVTNGMKGHYAALSHRWGNEEFTVTTTYNISCHQKGMPFSTLPKTFKDAITVARKLGLSYLWIDSLCIIQNDKEDWIRESATMQLIYAHAYCVLAATSASGADGGLFHSFNPLIEAPITVLDGKPLGHVLVSRARLETDVQEEEQDLASSLLNTRAWTLQERLLAQRMIHFHADRIYLECAHELRTNEGPIFPETDTSFTDSPLKSSRMTIRDWRHCLRVAEESKKPLEATCSPWNRPQVAKKSKKTSETLYNEAGSAYIPSLSTSEYENEFPSSDQFSYMWRSVIEDYSSRDLTEDSDRLIAIAGLADQVAKTAEKQYCAGFWQDTAWMFLCWLRKPGSECRPSPPELFRAPSWSWASMNGPVTYSSRELNSRNYHRSALGAKFKEVLTVGGTTYAQMGIRGRLKAVSVVDQTTENPPGKAASELRQLCETDQLLSRPCKHPVGWASPDTSMDAKDRFLVPFSEAESSDSTNHYTCLLVCVQSFNICEPVYPFHNPTLDVLLLKEDISGIQDSCPRYVRVGAGEIIHEAWFNDAPQTDIILV